MPFRRHRIRLFRLLLPAALTLAGFQVNAQATAEGVAASLRFVTAVLCSGVAARAGDGAIMAMVGIRN